MDLATTKNTTSTTIIYELFVHIDSPTFPTLVTIENSIPKSPFFANLLSLPHLLTRRTQRI
jgi:hypothetical protein